MLSVQGLLGVVHTIAPFFYQLGLFGCSTCAAYTLYIGSPSSWAHMFEQYPADPVACANVFIFFVYIFVDIPIFLMMCSNWRHGHIRECNARTRKGPCSTMISGRFFPLLLLLLLLLLLVLLLLLSSRPVPCLMAAWSPQSSTLFSSLLIWMHVHLIS